MRIIDVFLYNGEFDLLELRLKELQPYVDLFLLSEANQSYSGRPKELKYPEIESKFKEYNILYYPVTEFGENNYPNAWDREHFIRKTIGLKIMEIADKDDIIMISDLDELPNFRDRQLIELIQKCSFMENPLYTLAMKFFYYNFNWINSNRWNGTLIFKKIRLESIDLEDLRLKRFWIEPIKNGYHLSYFIPMDKIIEKIDFFSHQEFNTPEMKDPISIQNKIDNGLDLFDRPHEKWLRYTDDDFPENYDSIPDYMKKKVEIIQYMM